MSCMKYNFAKYPYGLCLGSYLMTRSQNQECFDNLMHLRKFARHLTKNFLIRDIYGIPFELVENQFLTK